MGRRIGLAVCGFMCAYLSLFFPLSGVPFSPAVFIRCMCAVIGVWCLWKTCAELRENPDEPDPEYVSLFNQTKTLFRIAKDAVSVWRTIEEVETTGLPRDSVLTVGETVMKAGEDPDALIDYLNARLDKLTDEYGKELVVLCLLWKRGFGRPLPSPAVEQDDEILIDSSKKIVRQSYDCLTQDDVEGVYSDVSETEDIRQPFPANEDRWSDGTGDDSGDSRTGDEEDEGMITDDGTVYWFVYLEREGETRIYRKSGKEEAENVYNEEAAKGGDVYAPVKTTWTGICKRHGKRLEDMRYVMKGDDENE